MKGLAQVNFPIIINCIRFILFFATVSEISRTLFGNYG